MVVFCGEMQFLGKGDLSPWDQGRIQGGPRVPWPPILSESFFFLNIQAFASRMYLIASQRTSISKNLPQEHVPETPQKIVPFATLMGAIVPIMPLHTISLGLIYHKILCPSLGMVADKCINQLSLLFFITDTVDKKYFGLLGPPH